MYAEVLKLVERVRHELQPIDAKILNHSYLQALQDGRIERERLRLFAAQQAYIIGSDLRSVALMVARASSEGSRAFFLELLEGERAALNALESFTAAVSGPAATAGAEEPLPGAFAYCAFVAWLSLYASEAEFAGALLINLPVWGPIAAAWPRRCEAATGCPARTSPSSRCLRQLRRASKIELRLWSLRVWPTVLLLARSAGPPRCCRDMSCSSGTPWPRYLCPSDKEIRRLRSKLRITVPLSETMLAVILMKSENGFRL